MFKNLNTILVLLSLFCKPSDSSRLNANSFCKLIEKECVQRNAPYIRECGRSMCTKNDTECKEYLRIENRFKHHNRLSESTTLSFTLMNHMRNFNEKLLSESFRKFQKGIKTCAKSAYKWRSNDVCVRGRNCFGITFDRIRFLYADAAKNKQNKQRQFEAFKSIKNLEQTDCPCPKLKPFTCGPENNHCSLNKEACDSFSLKTNATHLKGKQSHFLGIRKCGNNFSLIG